MKLSTVKSAVMAAIATQTPVMLQGAPGVGKSDIIREVADELGFRVIDIRLSQLDPVDLRGIPSVTNGTTTWNVPAFLPKDPDEKVLIFLDEINSAPQAVQAAAYQLVLDRKLGEYELPKNVVLVAAGNRTTDKAIVNQMATPLKNRFMHLKVDVNYQDWCNWALSAGIDPMIIAFQRYNNGKYLHEMLAAETETDAKKRAQMTDNLRVNNAFATPRTWAYASRFMKQGLDNAMIRVVLEGCIGEVATTEFMGYNKYWSQIPDLDKVVKEPKKVNVPDNQIVCYAVAMALVPRADKDTLENIMTYLGRMSDEYMVVFLKDVSRAKPELLMEPVFTEWVDKVGSDLLLGD